MKLKLIALSMAICSFVGYAMNEHTIQLRSEEVLRKRLSEIHMHHVMEKTRILNRLAEKKLVPGGVLIAIEQEVYDYGEYFGKDTMQRRMFAAFCMNKPMLYKAVLQDHPDALKEVEDLQKEAESPENLQETENALREMGFFSDDTE